MITYKTDSKESIESSESSMPVLAMCYDFDKTLTPVNLLAITKSKLNNSGKNRMNWLKRMTWIIT